MKLCGLYGIYGWTHIGDEVHPRHLLHHLAAHSEQCSMKEPLRTVLEHSPERSLLGSCLFFHNGLGDVRNVKVHHRVVFGYMMGVRLDGPQDVAGFVVPVVRDELEELARAFERRTKQRAYPSGRFRQEYDTNKGDDGKENLQSQGKAKLGLAFHVAHTVVCLVNIFLCRDYNINLPTQYAVMTPKILIHNSMASCTS